MRAEGLTPRPLAGLALHLADDGSASRWAMGPDFWGNMPDVFGAGRMVVILEQDKDWTSWERHPAGDELILMLDGRIRLHVEGAAPVELGPGTHVLMPRGAWHTADVLEPGRALFVTPGDGTEGRPR